MARMYVLLALLVVLTLPSAPATAEEMAPAAPPTALASLKDPAPIPSLDYVHIGSTSAHVTPLLPPGEPSSLEMQLRNMTTGELLNSSWRSQLHLRGLWQFNLAPAMSYCYQARSRDEHGDVSPWGPALCGAAGSHYYENLNTPVSDQYIAFEISLPDLDGDGHLDFFGAVSDDVDQPTLFARQNDGSFLDVTPTPLLELSHGAIFGDWDNDGDADVYHQRHVFLRNDGAPSFTDLSASLTGLLSGDVWNSRAPQAWADLDGDGYLEIIVSSSTDVRALKKSGATGLTLLAGATIGPFNTVQGLDVADHDGDGDADLCVVDFDGIEIFENDGAGNLNLIAPGANLTLNNVAAWGDLDDDGWPDLAISNTVRGVEIAMNLRNGTYQKQSWRIVGDPLLPEPNGSSVSTAQGLDWCDADNDGDLDLLVQRGGETGTVLCRNDGSGVLYAPDDCFSELLCRLDLDTDIVNGDFDEDGILDVFRPGTAIAYGKAGIDVANHNWVIFQLVGVAPSNRMAVGARMRLTAGSDTQYRQLWATAPRGSQGSPFLHFGLGSARIIDSIVIQWPSGESDSYRDVQVNRRYTITEGDPVIGVEYPVGDATVAMLSPARPNPFQASTVIALELPRASHVEAIIYDLHGRVVRRLEDRPYASGHHLLGWDARDADGLRVSGGVYFLKVRTDAQDLIQRMVVLR